MLVDMAGSRSCGGRALQDRGFDEENAPIIFRCKFLQDDISTIYAI